MTVPKCVGGVSTTPVYTHRRLFKVAAGLTALCGVSDLPGLRQFLQFVSREKLLCRQLCWFATCGLQLSQLHNLPCMPGISANHQDCLVDVKTTMTLLLRVSIQASSEQLATKMHSAETGDVAMCDVMRHSANQGLQREENVEGRQLYCI